MKGVGMNVFRDDKELQVGESILEKLLKRIECSRISVIIFSEDYAASSWCLEEVEKIIECSKTFQQPVLSIFYMVDLRSLKEALAKHQRHFSADNMSRWREALKEAANLPSFKCRDGNGEEKQCIQKFLKDILATLGAILLNERRDNIYIVHDGANGRQIGEIFVSDKEIAIGSNGIAVLEGTYSGLPVAVKRLPKPSHHEDSKEVQILTKSDDNQNIVRLYRIESDRDFVYLALQRCTCSLADLIQIYSNPSHEYEDRLDSVKGIIGDINLWKAKGRPSPLLLELMRDVVSGLVHLHKLKIIHQGLKPQNVLIIKEEEESLRAKLSDMGISKPSHPGQSYLGTQATVCGTLGWRAPEQILGEDQTSALDLFSLGCVLFFCTTRGKHPFGDHFERETNIREKREPDLSAVEYIIPEAENLFSKLLVPQPKSRPEALQVLQHPLFWDSNKRLSFVCQTSVRVKLKDESNTNDLLNALENIAKSTFGEKWDIVMDPTFIANECPPRSYNFKRVRDLLRVMRNKWTHYEELSKEIQEILGPVPEGFDDYFASLFPKLLIEVYKVVDKYCNKEERFQKYFRSKV